jgi:hypothetical protein
VRSRLAFAATTVGAGFATTRFFARFDFFATGFFFAGSFRADFAFTTFAGRSGGDCDGRSIGAASLVGAPVPHAIARTSSARMEKA